MPALYEKQKELNLKKEKATKEIEDMKYEVRGKTHKIKEQIAEIQA